ncbi:MAG TPA: glycosyltransferase [Chthoniobacterales bacterium]|nr:glycosyltransferase [Chthoniobacterales bacterium]
MSRCDLHLHSKFSDRSEDWIFRRFDFPDSYSNPPELYAQAKSAGMDFVTLTDHDTIEGGLTLSHLSDTFLSEQVTTYFPQDPCKLNLLVWGISEGQHAQISSLRENILDLQAFLQQETIAHAVAHPLYSINGKLSTSHLERLILLFQHFEGINGLRDALLSDLTRHLLAQLTPAKVDEFANRHDLAPTHPDPWKKILVGGSDDHGGLFVGSVFTETPPATTPAQFLDHIRAGRCAPHGQGGTPLALSHGFYNTLASFIQDRFTAKLGPSAGLVEKMFSRFMEGRDPTEFTLKEKAGFVTQGVLSGKIFELAKPGNLSLWRELSGYFAQPEVKARLAREVADVTEPERRTFIMANAACEQLAFRFFEKFVKQLNAGNVIESVQALASIAPILVVLAPYIYAFHSQAPSRRWLRQICRDFTGAIPPQLQNRKRAWFTDTLEDVNGVSTTIRKMAAEAREAGEELVVVTSRSELTLDGLPIKNFKPIGEFELPEYELQKLSFPPILQMLDYIQRENFSEIIISTPGPIGLTALLAGKMLNLETSGIYHTDFPQYIRILTEDSFLESLAWKYMQWFYGQLDTIFVNSEQYRRSWIARGIDPAKLKILPRGLDTRLFTPGRSEPDFWKQFGSNGDGVRLLFVGRVSREKDLDILVQAFRNLRQENIPVQLSIVGHGPFSKELAAMLPEACYTGYLNGTDLARAYASSDIFVFPSTTDTFGNVIIEAQAAGLPVIVSDVGGPRELVTDGVSGLITKARDPADFTSAIRRLVADESLRKEMSAAARRSVEDRSWPSAFRKFWAATEIS